MRLVRGAWKILVGVKDGLVLLFMLLFFGALYTGLTARPNAKAIGEGALLLDLKGSIVEQPQVASPSELISGRAPTKQYRLSDLIRALDAAAVDDRVKVVVLDLDGFTGGGQVSMLLPPATATTAISSPRMRPKSGSIRWASRCFRVRAGRGFITKG
jgi:protease IV